MKRKNYPITYFFPMVILWLSLFSFGTANAQQVCADRVVSNTTTCNGNHDYGFYAEDLVFGYDGLSHFYYVVDGTLTEYYDGTATLWMEVANEDDSDMRFEIDATLSGRTSQGSPHDAYCYSGDFSDWYYYTGMSGTLTGHNYLEGAKADFTWRMNMPELGTGANLHNAGVFGMSSWLDVTVTSQPDEDWLWLDTDNDQTDMNLVLSGEPGACDNPPSEITLNCADDINVTAAVGDNGAYVSWDEPTASTTCMVDGAVDCSNTPSYVDGFMYVGEHDGSKYFCSNGNNYDWWDAKYLSEQGGGHLLTINDQAENDFIQDAIMAPYAWMGYTDEDWEGEWQWVYGSSNYTHWKNGEPNNCDPDYNGADYAVIKKNNGRWYDRNGNQHYEFVMEIPCSSTQEPGTVTLTQTAGQANGDFFTVGTHTISYQATDDCGNVETCSFTITVNPAPTGDITMNCDDDITVTAAVGTNGATVTFNAPTASTTCSLGGLTVTQTAGQASGSFFAIGTHTITFTATDDCGDVATCTFTITVNPAPTGEITMTCNDDITVTAATGATGATVTFNAPTASTTCSLGGLTVTQTAGQASGSFFAIGTHTITFTATDDCGDVATCTFTITVEEGVPADPASVGDFVWSDDNGNGIQDAGEPGISGVWIILYDCNDNFVASTQSDANGHYSFTDLTPGDYKVKFAGMTGFHISPANQGGDDANDSDIVGWSGYTECFTLASGENNTTIDAGLVPDTPPSEITMTCNDDITVTAVTGANGATVTFDAPTATTTCASGGLTVTQTGGPASGSYFAIGTHTINFTATDNCGNLSTCSFTVTVQEASTGDAASVGDRVWQDTNGNGIQDAGEPGISGVWVILYACDDTFIASTQTDANGNYSFGELAAGTYKIKFAGMPGFHVSPSNQGNDDTVDSDIIGWSGYTECFTLASGENNTTIDAGLVPNNPPASEITMTCADDITVTAAAGTNGATVTFNAPTATTTCTSGGLTVTQTAGQTSGSFFAIGTHTVTFTATDNCGNTATCSFTITVQEGQPQTATIGDFVWNDLDGDGVHDANEPGLSGVTVQLLACDGTVVATTTTDANGNYSFTGVAPGTYKVQFTYSNGDFTATTPANGLTSCFTVSGGDNRTDIDAGFHEETSGGVASVGDRVWQDTNGNGIQDAGEPGISGVWVILYACDDTFIASTQTDANGNYSFGDLAAGSYKIKFAGMPGFYVSPSNQGNDDTIDSDIVGWSGYTECFALVAGENNTTIDGGLVPEGPACDDPIVANVSAITCDDNGTPNDPGDDTFTFVLTVTSGADWGWTGGGAATDMHNVRDPYTFGPYAIADGNVSFTIVDNDNVNCTYEVFAAAPAPCSSGTPSATIGDFVWNDLDGDGVYDANEPGLAGVTVQLLNCDGTVVATTTTDANGNYSFTGVVPGTYKVQFTYSNGDFTPTTPANGLTDCFTVNDGDNRTDIDAGFHEETSGGVASVGDFVWSDLNDNGIQDAGEPGIPGVWIILYDCNDNFIASTQTDANGHYSFGDLTAGTYKIKFAGMPGFHIALSNQGNDDTVDSDMVGWSGYTECFTLASGENNTDVDAGFVPDNIPSGATIGDFVWNDLDGDGVYDNGEPGLAGVIVQLLDCNGTVVATTQTGANGHYVFTEVNAGTYKVQFTYNNSDFTVTTPANGVTDCFTVADGDVNNDVDAGFHEEAGPAICSDREVTDITQCNGTTHSAFWTNGFINGMSDLNNNYHLLNPPASFTEYVDGTAHYVATVVNNTNPDAVFHMDIYLAGRTSTGTPHDAYCYDADFSQWYYYSELSGTLTGLGVLEGGAADLDWRMNQPQLGIGANLHEDGEFGFSSWIEVTVTSQPNNTDYTLNSAAQTDINIHLSGGANDCIDTGVCDNVTDSGIIGGDETGCGAYDPSLITNIELPSGGSGEIDYMWLASTTGRPTSMSQMIPGAHDATYDPGVITQTTYYVRCSKRAGCDDWTQGESNTVVKTVVDDCVDPAVGDFVWDDLNGNGIQDAGEPGMDNMWIILYDCNDNFIASTVSGANGHYEFTGLVAGDYKIKFAGASGYFPTQSNQGSDDTVDSDIVGWSGYTECFTLSGGDVTIDAGFHSASARIAQSFMTFEANKEVDKVKLNWTNNSGLINDHFVIEKSTDGVNFEPLAERASLSNDYSVKAYADVDENPVQGDNYYRLTLIYINGAKKVSEVRKVTFDYDLKAISLYPNPAHADAYLNLKEYAGMKGKVILFNALGLVQDVMEFEEIPENAVRVDMTKYNDGVYFFKVDVDGYRPQTLRLIYTEF